MSHSAKTTLPTLETTFDEHAVAIAKRQYFQESDASLAAMFERVANWVATPEQIGQAPHKHAEARQRFFDLMAKKRFCPGGRVLAGAATNHGNVLNCFVQDGSPEREGTTDWVLHLARKLALVTKVGGGNGVNLDPLPAKRPYTQQVGTLYISIAPEHADFAKVRDGRYMDLVRGEYLTKGYRFAKYLEQAQQASQQNILRVGDSVEGIWQAANQAVRILLEGQDVVLDLSDLRPEGTPVMGSGGNSSGPSSFAVEVFDNFGYWASLGGAEYAGAIATLRYVFAPTLRVIRQGGCLHPDTLVHTDRGTLRLGELVDPYHYGWQEHQLKVATDEGWKDSTQSYNNGNANTLKVLLDNGQHIQGTANHKLKVMRADGRREWLRLEQLQPDDYIIQVLDQHTGSPVTLSPLAEASLHHNTKKIRTPEVLSERLAFFLGYLWGDGFISDNRIGYAVAHGSAMMTETPKLFAELFGLEMRQEQKNDEKSVTFVTRSRALTDWLAQNGLHKGKAPSLNLPRAIRQAPRPVVAAFLRGLFEADGSINSGYASLSSASKQLLEDVAVMLAGLGIPSRLRRVESSPARYSDKPQFHLKVCSSMGQQRFNERIGWLENSRFAALAEFTPDEARESSWVLPHAAALLQETFAALPAGKKGSPSPYTPARKTLSRYIRGERNLTATGYSRLQSDTLLADKLPDFSHDEYYVKVKEVKKAGRMLTLDLSVAENKTYLANGFVSHNTRRGAGMATMSVTHPDIQDFITCKDLEREQAEGDISTFNISVLVDDSFMQAQSESQILRDIAEHAWQTGEPGLIFIDRINEHNPMRQSLGDIKSTNPCVTADTKILTSHGEKTVAELRDKPFEARYQGQDYAADKGFWSTGVQAIFELRSDKNLIQCTANHRFLACPAEAYRDDFDWQEAGQWLELAQLNTGDKLAFSNNADGTALESVTIESITAVGEAEVFDTTVRHVHRYISNGFISHNCGEIPLYAGEPCDLGAMNLSAYVRPATEGIAKGMEQFDFNTFADDVQTCVRFLDNVLEVNKFALEDNRLMSQRLRRLGLGVMGLADALIKMGYRYDSSAGRAAVQTIIAALRDNAHYASQELANERGTFPDFAQSALLEKRRNIALLTVAPTGTTSMLMGVSSGVEPIFAPFIYRKIGDSYAALISPLFQELLEQHPAPSAYQKEGSWDWDKVVEKVSANHGSVQGLDFIPEAVKAVLVCAHDISPEDHVRMQGVVQRTFDADGHKLANSISKTINMPNSASVDDVFAAYKLAYEQGCKGITVYRDGSRQFQVLSTSKESSEDNNEEQKTENDATSAAVSPAVQSIKPRFDRPARLTGFTDAVKLTMPTGEKRGFYVTVNKQNDTPSEVFIISGKAGDEAHADAEALGRLTSIALQYGVPAEAIVKTLRGINGGMYGSYQGRMVASKADIIAIALETAGVVNPDNLGVICPDCDAPLRFEEGCQKCESCGYSKCG